MTSFSTRTGSPAGIIGLGEHRPERIVTNAEVCNWIDTSDEWIQERTGIIERRFGRTDETVVTMGAEAGRKAIADAGIDPESIDTVIVATFSHQYATPSASAEISFLVGATNASAFDLGAACAGFCYAIGVANSLVNSGQSKTVLVVGSEKISDVINYEDRGTAFIFADGAGAVVISATAEQQIGPTVWGADGASKDAITMIPDNLTAQKEGVRSLLHMEGQRVFRWAVGSMGDVCARAIEAAGLTAADIDVFVPHQANLRITTAMLKHLNLNEDVIVAKDIQYQGNTSAASVPLALSQLRSSGQVTKGQTVLMVGFGAGLAYAAQVALVP